MGSDQGNRFRQRSIKSWTRWTSRLGVRSGDDYPDLNLLLYAYTTADSLRHAPQNDGGKTRLIRPTSRRLPRGQLFSDSCESMTHRRSLVRPDETRRGDPSVEEWLAQPGRSKSLRAPATTIHGFSSIWINEVGTAGNLTTGAHLAELAIEYQAEISIPEPTSRASRTAVVQSVDHRPQKNADHAGRLRPTGWKAATPPGPGPFGFVPSLDRR